MWRIVGRGLAVLLVLLLLLAGGGYLALRSSLPQTDGRIAVAGLHAEVTIARDADGIPTITAANDEGAAFGLGYAHAQDRLFQMELQRRFGAGRLAELFGEAAVSVDTQMRVLGLYRAAEAAWPKLSPEVQRGIEAYGAGVNAYLATRGFLLPPEFLLLRFKPGPWQPADTLVWGKLMDFQLGGNYRGELLRARMAQTVSADDLAFLYPDYPKDAPTTLAALTPLYRQLPLGALYAALPEVLGPHYASNNWVVDGAHSASGKPVLANDPHLAFNAPGFWYLARLKTPEREIAGATAPGTPLVIVGHNDKIAWGFTTTTADIEDLFIEKLDPADPARYMTSEGSAAFATRQETITVRDAAPVPLTVRSTRHGPVVSDMLPTRTFDPGYVVALSATFLDDSDLSAQAIWDIDRADDWPGFRNALKNFVGPPQNIVYADTGGTIGFIAAGRIPMRKNGDGWLPMPGWSGEYDWQGYVPFDELPQATNPATGHFVSANNKIVPGSYPSFHQPRLGLAVPRRAHRGNAYRDPAPIAQRQRRDPGRYAVDHGAPAGAADDPDRAVDRNGARGRPAAAAVGFPYGRRQGRAAAVHRLAARLCALGADRPAGRRGCGLLGFASGGDGGGADPAPRLVRRPQQSRDRDCDTRLVAALDQAIEELRKAYGDEMTRWQWGRAHIAYFPNAVFERVPLLRDWLRVTIPTPGGYDTVNRGPSLIRDEAHPYEQRFGAGLRIITDLAAPAESRMMITPGQSGNPLSAHYADLLSRWRAFDWLVPSRSSARATLTLAPAP